MVTTGPSLAHHIAIPAQPSGARIDPTDYADETVSSSSASTVSSIFDSVLSYDTDVSSPLTPPPDTLSHASGLSTAPQRESESIQSVPSKDLSVNLRRGRTIKYLSETSAGDIDRASLVPDSPASISSKEDETTPRAERPAPVWPMAQIRTSPVGCKSTLGDEAATSGSLIEAGNSSSSRGGCLKRGSHPGADNASTVSELAGTVSKLLDTRINADPAGETAPATRRDPPAWPSSRRKQSQPPSQTHEPPIATALPSSRSETFSLPEVQHRIVAESSLTGCVISSPVAPPPGYPLGSSRTSSAKSDAGSAPMSASSSASSGASAFERDGASGGPAPLWAQPPVRTNRLAGRAMSAGAEMAERPVFDFDEDQIKAGETDEVMEVIKASDGRIAVQSMQEQYVIRVWLPGFNINNILLSSRRGQIIQIVADHWDLDDHAQWSVRLGADANMREISAKFTGSELAITISRNKSRPGAASASVRSAPCAGYL